MHLLSSFSILLTLAVMLFGQLVITPPKLVAQGVTVIPPRLAAQQVITPPKALNGGGVIVNPPMNKAGGFTVLPPKSAKQGGVIGVAPPRDQTGGVSPRPPEIATQGGVGGAPPPGMGVSFIGNPLDEGYCPTSFTSPPICPAGETYELAVTDLGDTWEVRVSCVSPGKEAVLFAGVQTTQPGGGCCSGPFATFKGCPLVPDPLLFLPFTTEPFVFNNTVINIPEPDDRCDVPEGMYLQVFVKEGPGNWGATNAVYFFGSVPPICP